jgi:hypothetical protein
MPREQPGGLLGMSTSAATTTKVGESATTEWTSRCRCACEGVWQRVTYGCRGQYSGLRFLGVSDHRVGITLQVNVGSWVELG